MEKKCQTCGKIKKTPYKNVCKSCYQIEWISKINPKNCEKCGKIHKDSGKVCRNCRNNERNKRLRKNPCENCKRFNITKSNFNLCVTCYRNKIELDDPEKREKRRKQVRNSNRKIRGNIPLDAPVKKSCGFWIKNGYRWIYKPNHPNSAKQGNSKKQKGQIAEHRYIMSEFLKRPLKNHENVHHVNGDRIDNRIENLELWSKSQPSGQRVEDKIKWSIEFLSQYGYEVIKNNG